MPTPNPDESHDEFIERCMADDEAMADFPDQAQRFAFCESVWSQHQETNPESDAMPQIAQERRAFVADELRVEKRTEHEGRRIVGHAAVFNKLSEDLGGFREKIAPGAFARAISEKQDVRALFNHNPDFVLGRTASGTLRLSEDSEGLRVEIDPPETSLAQDVLHMLERRDITQMSFGFIVRNEEFEEDDNGNVTRTLQDVDLFDVSPVTFAAYPQTQVALRHLEQWRHEQTPDHARLKPSEIAKLRGRVELFLRRSKRRAPTR